MVTLPFLHRRGAQLDGRGTLAAALGSRLSGLLVGVVAEAECRVGTGWRALLKAGSGNRPWAGSGSESESGSRLKVEAGLESVQKSGGQEAISDRAQTRLMQTGRKFGQERTDREWLAA